MMMELTLEDHITFEEHREGTSEAPFFPLGPDRVRSEIRGRNAHQRFTCIFGILASAHCSLWMKKALVQSPETSNCGSGRHRSQTPQFEVARVESKVHGVVLRSLHATCPCSENKVCLEHSLSEILHLHLHLQGSNLLQKKVQPCAPGRACTSTCLTTAKFVRYSSCIH